MITLSPLQESDRGQFIKDNQEAFNYGALEEFGMRDNHFEEDEQIISRVTIEKSIDGGEAYRIMEDGKPVGGVIKLMATRETWIFFSLHLKPIAKALVMLPGAR